jgi:putative DNA primase/helicase
MASAASLHDASFQPKPALCSHDPYGLTGEVVGKLTQSSDNTAPLSHHAEQETFADLLNGWPPPEPLGAELPPVPEFDPELLPASLQALVVDVADRMQVPVDFPAVTVMATLSGVCGRRAVMLPKERDDTWAIVPNLWGAIIGPPGVMKSPVISAMTEPLRTIEREWRQGYDAALNEHKEEEERLKLDLAVWTETYKRARKANREAPERPSTVGLKPPRQRRLWTTDATCEKLHELLGDNPSGITVLRDELAGWLAGLDRQGRETDRSFFLECWNGDNSFTMDRIGRGSITVEHCCVSIFGGIQPARMRSYFASTMRDGSDDDGLIQRFQLLVWPDIRADWEYRDCPQNLQAKQAVEVLFRRIASFDAESQLRFRFDHAGQVLFREWYTTLERQCLRRADEHPLIQSHLAKYRSLMPSLALLLALADGETSLVSLRHAQHAADWCDYLESHARRVYAAQIGPRQQAAIALSRKLKSGWKSEARLFSLRDVYRNQWAGLSTRSEVRAALVLLEEANWVMRAPASLATGRPSEIYLINPQVGGADDTR